MTLYATLNDNYYSTKLLVPSGKLIYVMYIVDKLPLFSVS